MQASRTSLLVVRRIHGPAEQRLVPMGVAGLQLRIKEEPPIEISLDGKWIGTIRPPKWSTDLFEAVLEDSMNKEVRSQFEIQVGHHELTVNVTVPSALLYMAFTGVTPAIQSFDSAPGETVTFLCQYTPADRGYKIRLSREQPPQQKEQLPSERQAMVPLVPKPQPSGESPSPATSLPFGNRDEFSLLRTLAEHTEKVQSVAFSPDGQTLASGGWDETIKLWNLVTGKVLRTLTGHKYGVNSVAFSPDGQTLASGSIDRTIKLWNLATGKVLRTLTGHSNSVNSVAISPDGQTLASGSWDKTIKLWDVASGQVVRTLTRHAKAVESVAFSPDGQTLASCSNDNKIRLWNLATGKVLRTFKGLGYDFFSVAFSPDGKTLASGGMWDTSLWNLATGKLLPIGVRHRNAVVSVAFSPDGQTLASGSYDKTIKLCNLASDRRVCTLTEHTEMVQSVAFSPDGQTLASGSWDKTIKIWGKNRR